MRLLITGGAGFIGQNLSRLALRRGHAVTVIDDLSTSSRETISDLEIEFYESSILDFDQNVEALRGIDSVIHLAALGSVPRSIESPLTSHAANATGTLYLLEAARQVGVKHAVVASSSSVYGMNPALPKSEREWVRPMSPYAVTKLATEQYALAYQQSYDFSTMAFRFFNVYGPGQPAGHAYAAVIPVFIDALLRSDAVPINGDGLQSRDFTFVDTVCEALLQASEQRMSHPEPVNLAFGTNTNLLELLRTLEQIAGVTVPVVHRPERPGDVPHSQADNQVLRRLMPELVPVGLAEGLTKTLEWHRERDRAVR